jgi:hypothetical protein
VDWIHLTRYGPVVGSFECGNEPSGSVTGREFLDQLSISFSRRYLLYGHHQLLRMSYITNTQTN